MGIGPDGITRVEIAAQAWGWVADRAGNGLSARAITLSGPVYADATTATVLTSIITDFRGVIPGWVQTGTYVLTVAEVTQTVEAISATDMIESRTFQHEGNLYVSTGAWPYTAARAGGVYLFSVALSIAPAGTSAIFSLRKNGILGSTVTVAAGTLAAFSSTIVTYSPGDVFTVDVDQIGSTEPGANAVVTVGGLT